MAKLVEKYAIVYISLINLFIIYSIESAIITPFKVFDDALIMAQDASDVLMMQMFYGTAFFEN